MITGLQKYFGREMILFEEIGSRIVVMSSGRPIGEVYLYLLLLLLFGDEKIVQ